MEAYALIRWSVPIGSAAINPQDDKGYWVHYNGSSCQTFLNGKHTVKSLIWDAPKLNT